MATTTTATAPTRLETGRVGVWWRWLIVAVCVPPLAWAAWMLARVDGGLGAPIGADRLMGSPSATPLEAQRALASRPIDGRAVRILAEAADAWDSPERALALWKVAVVRDPRNFLIRARLTERELGAGNYDAAIEHLDAMLRVVPDLRPHLLRSVVPLLSDARMRSALISRLARDPPWRDSLAPILLEENTPAEPADALLGEFAAALPPSSNELRARITLLRRLGDGQQARATWLDSLPDAERALDGQPFDGGFEGSYGQTGSGLGDYGWIWPQIAGVGASVDSSAPFAGKQALLFEFSSNRAIRFIGPRQILQLLPGQYRLEATADNRTGSPRPFVWELHCNGGPATREALAGVPLLGLRGWSTAEADFEVPDGCAEQTLQLRHDARSLDERRLGGSLALDEVRITAGAYKEPQ